MEKLTENRYLKSFLIVLLIICTVSLGFLVLPIIHPNDPKRSTEDKKAIDFNEIGISDKNVLELSELTIPEKDDDRTASSTPLVVSAREQIGKTVIYDPAYVGLSYPGGDVPIERGVCTDVVIRALRDAYQMDLQKLVHEDMKRAFTKYPKIWGLKKTDKNIDHRRVPNLKCYFKRKGYSLSATKKKEDYLPGDIVTCTVGRNRPHIMIVSDQKTNNGTPFVIHNIGSGAQEEDRLFDFPIHGHYRIKK